MCVCVKISRRSLKLRGVFVRGQQSARKAGKNVPYLSGRAANCGIKAQCKVRLVSLLTVFSQAISVENVIGGYGTVTPYC